MQRRAFFKLVGAAAAVAAVPAFSACSAVSTPSAEGTGVLGQLTAETGRPAPTPLASLAGKPVRFDQVTDRGDMRAVVTEFLR